MEGMKDKCEKKENRQIASFNSFFHRSACLQKNFYGQVLSIRVFSSDGHYGQIVSLRRLTLSRHVINLIQ